MGEAIANGTKTSETLLRALEGREDRLARVKARLDSLQKRVICSAPPTRGEIEERLAEIIAAVERMDRESQGELRLLVGEIAAVPHQQFGGNKVVLRARFELRLAAILPVRLRGLLTKSLEGPVDQHFERIPMQVDLFTPSTGPQYGLEALRLKETESLGLTAIGRRLGISKRQADIAVQYGAALRAAGLTDPYIELVEPPAAASRWRKRGQGAPRRRKPTAENNDTRGAA